MGNHEAKRGLPIRTGKRKAYHQRYFRSRYPVNKLKRILRHNGLPAARSWAAAHEADHHLLKLLNQGVKVRES